MEAFKFEIDDVPEKDWKVIRAMREFLDGIKQPITNADRIRAMSDEELEAFLIDVDLDKVGSPFITEWGKWLKQPAEV